MQHGGESPPPFPWEIEMRQKQRRPILVGLLITAAVVGVIAAAMVGIPKYRVYSQRLRGEAALREAVWVRKIEIESAKAKLESATKLREADIIRAEGAAQAEVIRATGAAEANEIIASGLGGPEGYLRYLWIQGLQDDNSEVIYIATEAGLPILEAGRGLSPPVR